MTEVTDTAAAARAAQAVIDAGQHWEDFKLAVVAIRRTRLTPWSVTALLADELDIPIADARLLAAIAAIIPKRQSDTVAA